MTAPAFFKRQLLGFLASCVLSAALVAVVLVWTGNAAGVLPSSPTSEPTHSRVQQLLETHGCWTGGPPADMRHRVPGHVVVTTRKGRTVYGGPRLVGKALDQEFGDRPAGLIVRGFCR